VLEGDNQKQADFLSRSLAKCDSKKLYDLHLVISCIGRPEHLTLFELGIAKKVDFAFAGRQSLRVAQLLEDRVIEIGAIHTYVELYARLPVDLIPSVVLVCAEQSDYEGNLYTGPNTEDTPVIVEAAAFHDGIVIAQANEIVDKLPRVDIPGSWVDVVVPADRPFAVEPLFTREPRQITQLQILMGIMVIRGVYERHQVRSVNHGIGFDTAAIELLLPTYGESLGLRGKICEHWTINPHPTMIPAIESGWVKSIHCFGSEVGMDDYVRARPDIYFTGRDGSMRSKRVLYQMAGQYAVDAFVGATLQMDGDANSSTVTTGRLAGFGGAPNMGSDTRGRRHDDAHLRLGHYRSGFAEPNARMSETPALSALMALRARWECHSLKWGPPGRGGVGKSLIAGFIAQFYKTRGVRANCVDTDPVNRTFSQDPRASALDGQTSSSEPPMMSFGEAESQIVEFSLNLPNQGAFTFRTYQQSSC
jgi:malonate decarboxylase alpha subunit